MTPKKIYIYKEQENYYVLNEQCLGNIEVDKVIFTSHEMIPYILESEHNRIVDELKAEMPKWISVAERLPNKETDGEKVLLYREMNESQKLMSISVMDTFLVKHCEPSSFWMPLPKPPTK